MSAESEIEGYQAIRNGDPYASAPSNTRRNPLREDYDYGYDIGCKRAEREIAEEKELEREIAEHNRSLFEKDKDEPPSSSGSSSDSSLGCGCLLIIILLVLIMRVTSCWKEHKTDKSSREMTTVVNYVAPSWLGELPTGVHYFPNAKLGKGFVPHTIATETKALLIWPMLNENIGDINEAVRNLTNAKFDLQQTNPEALITTLVVDCDEKMPFYAGLCQKGVNCITISQLQGFVVNYFQD